MRDNSIYQLDSHYQSLADQAYQDYLEYSLYEFLCQLKKDCNSPRTYILPNDLTRITRFCEVGE